MNCERCQGTGKDEIDPNARIPVRYTCPDCGGSGVTYSCDDAGANPPNSWPVNYTPEKS